MELTDRFSQALSYAFELHREQKRKGTEIPYISHLLEVAGIVIEYGGNEDEAIAALLHDAVEDQGGSEIRAEIGLRFGENVAKIVDRTKFYSMKNNKLTNPHYGVSNLTKPSESQFVRRGLVGEWKEGYFTAEMLEELRQMNKNKMGEFASWFDLL